MNGISRNWGSGESSATGSARSASAGRRTHHYATGRDPTSSVAESIFRTAHSTPPPQQTERERAIALLAAAAAPHNATERKVMEMGLDKWVKTGGEAWNETLRQVAARRIMEAYDKKEKTLSLSNLCLTTLPSEIGNLRHLKQMFLSGNRLTTLLKEIGNLTQLTDLHLNNNKLTDLPNEIGNLTNLRQLHINKNKLTVLPHQIVNFTNLQELYIENNPDLQSLPMELGNFRNLTHISISETQIPVEVRNAILRRTRAARNEEGLIHLQDRVATWQAYGKTKFDLQFLSNELLISRTQKTTINEWLVRLERCQDFKYKRQDVAMIVCNMLGALNTSAEFKDAFFGKVEEDLASCDDRASMLLNMLYTDYMLYTIDPNATDKAKITLLVGLAKTLTLRETLESMIVEYQAVNNTVLTESVEIFLFHEITNKDLGLLTAIDNMHFAVIGRAAHVVDKAKLRAAVNQKYMDTLCNQEALDKILIKYPEYKKGKEHIETTAIAKHTAIEDENWGDKWGQYNKAMAGLEAEKEHALRKLKKEFINEILKGELPSSNLPGLVPGNDDAGSKLD